MAEDKNTTLAERIEQLIVGGQKDVLAKLDMISVDIGSLKSDVGSLKSDVGSLKSDVGWIKQELKRIDKKHDINADAQYDLLQDVKKDVGEVKEKLETHLRVPHAVA